MTEWDNVPAHQRAAYEQLGLRLANAVRDAIEEAEGLEQDKVTGMEFYIALTSGAVYEVKLRRTDAQEIN